jgi:hypothetical protein
LQRRLVWQSLSPFMKQENNTDCLWREVNAGDGLLDR